MATAVASGGGVITIKQGVRNDIAGYTADYYVSGHLAENEITLAALGIYLDWSIRIERLQNKSFMPLTETPDGWQQVSWPESLLMTPLPSSSLSWGFLADATWYLGEKTPALAVPKEYSATARDKPTGEG